MLYVGLAFCCTISACYIATTPKQQLFVQLLAALHPLDVCVHLMALLKWVYCLVPEAAGDQSVNPACGTVSTPPQA